MRRRDNANVLACSKRRYVRLPCVDLTQNTVFLLLAALEIVQLLSAQIAKTRLFAPVGFRRPLLNCRFA